jgi:hypothetical protein
MSNLKYEQKTMTLKDGKVATWPEFSYEFNGKACKFGIGLSKIEKILYLASTYPEFTDIIIGLKGKKDEHKVVNSAIKNLKADFMAGRISASEYELKQAELVANA